MKTSLLCLVSSNVLSLAVRVARVKTSPGLWAAEQDTVSGCKCTGPCAPRGWDLWKCDSCKTEKCGQRGKVKLWERWDYCDYSQLDDFESRSFSQKMDYFWTNVVADTTRTRAEDVISIAKTFVTSAVTSFDNWRPEMPEGRRKVIHGVGSVCQIALEIGQHSPYTGLLGPGTQKGLVRIGNAAAISADGPGLTPGFGFKFPRSGVPSGDWVMLYDLAISGSWNFFKVNVSNHIPSASEIATKFFAEKFEQASQCPYQVGLSDLAKFSQDGQEVSKPNFPFKLFMVPSKTVQQDESVKDLADLHGLIDSIPVGSKLFDVYACGEPLGEEIRPADGGVEGTCGKPLLLGELRTTSQCTTSRYGDTAFHIRHTRIEEDWRAKPEYFEHGEYSGSKACNYEGAKIDMSYGRCSMLNSDA